MRAREIPRNEWVGFFDTFSKQHEGWVATIEVMGSQIGDQEESTRLPLVGLSADTKGRGAGIAIMVGDRPEGHVTRIVNAPKRVWLKESEEPAHDAIEVESEDGTTTLLHFQHVPPEQTERQLPGRV